MKKLLGTGLILLSTLFIGYSQQDNNTSDDVYYNGADDQQVTSAPIDQSSAYSDDDNSAPTYQTFYDQLSPYGNWINYPGYGYCWAPNSMDPGFSPYMTNGHWVYTDMGWTWVSDFQWGWGPFHYGRWFEDPNYGWLWEPGFDWAPAWVIWGDYGGYYGWACLGPHDVLSPHFRPQPGHWHFIEHQYMGRDDFREHIRRSDDLDHGRDINYRVNIISHANTYHQSVFFEGPRPEEVERYSGQKVQRMQINNVRKPEQTRVNNNQVNIYRPNIVRNNDQHVTPARVTNPQDMRQTNRPQQEQPRNNPQPERQPNHDWTPPRQNVQPQRENPQPQQRYNAPSQPQRQNYTPPSQPQRTFFPTERPVQQQQQQHFSAPQQQHFSAPPSRGGGGGGRR